MHLFNDYYLNIWNKYVNNITCNHNELNSLELLYERPFDAIFVLGKTALKEKQTHCS